MLDQLNQLNRNKLPMPLFLTLTYPDEFPNSPRIAKEHLRAFKERFRRKWGKVPAFWRMELMDRKSGDNVGLVAPHFHLLIFLDLEPSEMYEWTSRSWYEVVGSGDDRHLLAGTRVDKISSWRGMMSYAAKYMAKPEALAPGQESPGRFWGKWNADLLPVDVVEDRISVEDSYKIRRHMARYAGIPLKKYANSPTFKAYVPSDVVRRLLEYYGYYRP